MRVFLALGFVMACYYMVAQQPTVIKVRKPEKEKCTASLLGSSGGNISYRQLGALSVLKVHGPCDYQIKSYVLYTVVNEKIIFEIKSETDSLSQHTQLALRRLPVGARFYVEKIQVKSLASGQTFSLPNLKFKVTD